jgi:cysteine desulfurase/selenocysteine lyase
MINTDEIRKDFPILNLKKNGKRLVYLDSAATSQKPMQVINAVSDYYQTYNANIHRGMYDISVKATEEYTNSKELAADWINAGSYREIVYVRNATEAINIVALSWGNENIKEGDTILLTTMEHHSNIVPWQMLAERKKAHLEYVKLNESKFIDMDDYREKLKKNPKIVAFTHVSNVLGTVNPAKEMVELAHSNGAVVLVDGAQAAPHIGVDVKNIDCDFYAFSSHKMLGPAGIGVLYAKEDILENMPPVLGGGDMIRSVNFDKSEWNELPWKFEAGTSNIEGGIGFGAAIKYLKGVGIKNIETHENAITMYALKRLADVKGMSIFGPGIEEINKRIGVISFKIDGAHPHDIATIFNSEGIAIRAGHHCAMPLVRELLSENAVARISFYIYNTQEEVDTVIDAIAKVKEVLRLNKQ